MERSRIYVIVMLCCLLPCNAGPDVPIFARESPPVADVVCDELADAIENAKEVLYLTLHLEYDCPPEPTEAPPPPPSTKPPPTQPPPTQPPPTQPPPTQPPPTHSPPEPEPTPSLPPPPPPPPPPPQTTQVIPIIGESSYSEYSSFQSGGQMSEGSDLDEQIGEGPECFTRPDAADYRGEVSITVNIYTCQRWDSSEPHEVESIYREKFSQDSNFCRNIPGSGEGAWCYTTNPEVEWEYCDVGEFKDECTSKPDIPDLVENVCDGQDPECYTDRYGSDYLGYVSVTESGLTCQRWNIDYPHTRKNKYKPASDSLRFGDHNYCRNLGYSINGIQLSDRRRPWCYTTDPDVLWEYCDVPLPCDVCEGRDFDENADVHYAASYPECHLRADSSDYRGFINHTRSGIPCQRWIDQVPHPIAKGNVMLFGHHDNYCRIRRHAYRTGKKPFCFTTDPDVEWEYCEVGDRHEICLNEQLKPVAPYIGYNPECYTEKDGIDYKGFVSTTASGYTCEYWRDRVNNKRFRKAFREEENYCRTLGIAASPYGKPWCFIEGHPTLAWEYCDVGPRYLNCLDAEK